MPYVPNPAHGVEAVLECYEKYLRAMPVRSSSSLDQRFWLFTHLSNFVGLHHLCRIRHFRKDFRGAGHCWQTASSRLASTHEVFRRSHGLAQYGQRASNYRDRRVLWLLRPLTFGLPLHFMTSGHIVILRHAQRTHVSSHAIGLLLRYALDHPYLRTPASAASTQPDPEGDVQPLQAPFSASAAGQPPRGLGLRRCQWQCHHLNQPSSRAAQRMGFKEEGLIRMQRIVATGNETGRKNDGGFTGSRTSWMGSVTWKDWEEGGVRDLVDKQMNREI